MVKLKANRRLDYGHRSLQPGDIFEPHSELDLRLLTTRPPGPLGVEPAASIVEKEHGESKSEAKDESASGRDTHTEGDEAKAAQTPRGRGRRRAQTKDDHEGRALTRRYNRRDLVATDKPASDPGEQI